MKAGASEKLAKETEALTLALNNFGVVDLAGETDQPIDVVANTFSEIGGAFGIDRLRAGAQDALGSMSQWDSLAVHGQLSNLGTEQLNATRQVLTSDGDIKAYLKARGSEVDKLKRQLRQMELARDWSFAKFALATDAIRAALG